MSVGETYLSRPRNSRSFLYPRVRIAVVIPMRIEKQRRRELEPQEHHAITCRLLCAMVSEQEPAPETVQEGQRHCANEGRGDVVNLKIVE